MLTSYLAATNALLQQPPATNPLYSTALLTTFINTARGQLAGESEAIRFIASLAVSAGTTVYPFTSISLTGAAGVQGVINVRTAWVTVGTGQRFLYTRPFEWFSLFRLNSPVPRTGPPVTWSQYGQGAEARTSPNPVGGGTIHIAPVPDDAYTLKLDCVCYPIALADDTTPEAIPYLWTDAVPYFAAYLALLSAQSASRQADAQRMMTLYTQFVTRARRAATPSVLPVQYPQQPTPTRANQLGVQASGQ